MRLKDQVALVTGGGRGVGRATALGLAREGAAVAVNYFRSREGAEAVVAQIQEGGGRAMAIQADISEDPRVRDMVGKVLSEWGRLDILVNNTAIPPTLRLEDLEGMTEEVWDRIFAVNLKGTFFCSRAVAPIMKRQQTGRILNLVSIAGITGRGDSLAYCTSEAGILSLTRSLAITLAPEIRVNAIAVDSGDAHAPAGSSLLGRAATAEDVAEVVVSFAADATFVTGQVLKVDGGSTL